MTPLVITQEERLVSLYSKQREELDETLQGTDYILSTLVSRHIRELEAVIRKDGEERESLMLVLAEFHNKMTKYKRDENVSSSDVKRLLDMH